MTLKHILIITDEPFPLTVGTSGQLIKEAQTLLREGFEVTVLTSNKSPFMLTEGVLRFKGIKILYIPIISLKGLPILNITNFVKVINKLSPKIICAYNSRMAFYSLIAAKIQNCPLVLSLHDINSLISLQSDTNLLLRYIGHSIFYIQEYLPVRMNDHIITTTRELKELMCKYYRISEKNIDVVLNSPSLEEFSHIPKLNNLAIAEKFTIVYAGTIDHFRNLEGVIDALKYITKNDILFVIIGGTYVHHKKYLERLKNKEGFNEKVLFVGHLPRKTTLAYINSCDICIIPHKRNFYTEHVVPTKVHDYAALGKPIVTTPLRPILNLYGKSVITWDGNDPKSLADIISVLYTDNTLRKRLSQSVKELFIQQYCWEIQSKRFLQVFKSLL